MQYFVDNNSEIHSLAESWPGCVVHVYQDSREVEISSIDTGELLYTFELYDSLAALDESGIDTREYRLKMQLVELAIQSYIRGVL